MTHKTRAGCLTVAVLATSMAAGGPVIAGQRSTDENKKPSVALKATPPLGFAPLKVRAVVDLKGGANDYADFYCANVEWDWADGTTSGSSEDCEPYEAGKSEIKRRFSVEHVFRRADNYRVAFRLKRRDKAVGFATVQVQVRPGLPEGL